MAERSGSPSARIDSFERPVPDPHFEIDGIRLPRDHAAIFFGDGGSLKSLLALYFTGRLSQRGARILYADWEMSGPDHRDRLERLFGTPMPAIEYLRCERPLIDERDRIQRSVRQHDIEYLICDSIAFALNGPPESAEHAMQYNRCLRQIGIGSLSLAHVTKTDGGDQKPFGSAFWHNSARATWFVKHDVITADGSTITVGLINRKANLGAHQPSVGFQLEFAADRTFVTTIDLADVQALAGYLPIRARVAHFLRNRRTTATLAEIATALEEKQDSVAKAIKRSKEFTQVLDMNGVLRVALADWHHLNERE
jgi:hypothetical protein